VTSPRGGGLPARRSPAGTPGLRVGVPALCLAVWLAHAALLAWMAGADVLQVPLSGGGASATMPAGA